MRLRRFAGLLLLVCALVPLARGDDVPRQLNWDDLAVRLSAAENPFARLTMDQLEALADVAGFRDRKARGGTLSGEEVLAEKTAAEKLKRDSIDIEGLLAKRDEIAAKKQKLASAVNPALDGKTVKLPGYVLPIEFNGKQVTEFLLVPWVGACIHTPPPPPNQIVHVKTDKPLEISGAFDAVWVTGKMAAGATRQAVFITDGTTEIDVGYSLRASQVERYQN
jgi:uncharacterized protein